jgi:hypothetical protein
VARTLERGASMPHLSCWGFTPGSRAASRHVHPGATFIRPSGAVSMGMIGVGGENAGLSAALGITAMEGAAAVERAGRETRATAGREAGATLGMAVNRRVLSRSSWAWGRRTGHARAPGGARACLTLLLGDFPGVRARLRGASTRGYFHSPLRGSFDRLRFHP